VQAEAQTLAAVVVVLDQLVVHAKAEMVAQE
jgi:hypothetical protein